MADTKPNVLFVDDEKMLLELYAIKFIKNGFNVVTSSTAEKALALLKDGYKPDVILFDITMPEMSGYEFLEKLSDFKLPRHCLKIALTNESQDGEQIHTRELGADEHLVKALYTPAQLVVKVRELLQKFA